MLCLPTSSAPPLSSVSAMTEVRTSSDAGRRARTLDDDDDDDDDDEEEGEKEMDEGRMVEERPVGRMNPLFTMSPSIFISRCSSSSSSSLNSSPVPLPPGPPPLPAATAFIVRV